MEDKCPPPPPQISEFFVWDSEGAQKCFILRDQTTGDLKSHHLQAQATLTALSVPHGHLFLQQSCYVGNPLSYKYALPYIYSQSHIMREKCYIFKGTHSLFGGHVPPGPPLSPAQLHVQFIHRLKGERMENTYKAWV